MVGATIAFSVFYFFFSFIAIFFSWVLLALWMTFYLITSLRNPGLPTTEITEEDIEKIKLNP